MISWLKRLIDSHPVSAEELSCLVDDRLRARRDAAVRGHVEGCDTCAGKLAELRDTKAMLAALLQASLPRSFVLTPQEAGIPAKSPPAPRPARVVFAPALALSVLVALLAVDFAAIGGGAGSDESNSRDTAALSKAAEADSAGTTAPALDAARSAAATPSAPTVGAAAEGVAERPPLAQAAESAQPAATATNRRPQPAPADEARGPAPAEDADRALIRTLEGLAALALAGSLAYLWYRSRPTAG